MAPKTAARNMAFLIIFSAAVYLPMIGKGYIHDDFIHLYHAGFNTFWDGFLKPSGDIFFTPITNLSFQLDWALWKGRHPFPSALQNLILHLANILLLYALVFRLWKSHYAALWASLGFSLLFPANTWALLWIATRAHLLMALFCLLAMHSVLSLAASERHRTAWMIAVLAGAVCALLSKESGITILFALPVMLVYSKKLHWKKDFSPVDFLMMGLLLAVFATYFAVRRISGAIAINFNSNDWYSYSTDWRVLSENLLRYAWRTYGLLAFVGAAHFLKRSFQGTAPRVSSITRSEISLSILLFILAVTPFLLMRARSGIYTYLAGMFAALLLAAVLRSFEESAPAIGKRKPYAAWTPIVVIFVVCIAFTYGYGRRWVTMAKTSTSVLHQIHSELPRIRPGSMIVVAYAEADRERRFPEALAWGFPYALRILYQDSTLKGALIGKGDALPPDEKSTMACFRYEPGTGTRVRILKLNSCEALRAGD